MDWTVVERDIDKNIYLRWTRSVEAISFYFFEFWESDKKCLCMPNKLIAPSFRHFKHFLLASWILCVLYENISLCDFGRNIFDKSSKCSGDFEDNCQKYVTKLAKYSFRNFSWHIYVWIVSRSCQEDPVLDQLKIISPYINNQF